MPLSKHFENVFSGVLVDAESTFGVQTHVSVQPKLLGIETLAALVVDTSSTYLEVPSSSSSDIVKEPSVLGPETTAGALVEPLDRHKKRPRQLFSPPRHKKARNEVHGYNYEFTNVSPLHANGNSSALFPSAGVNNGAEATEIDYIWERDKISAIARLVVDSPSYVSPTSKMPPQSSNDDDICIFNRVASEQRGAQVSPENTLAPLCSRENGDPLETDMHDYMQHALETIAHLVVDHSSSHSATLRSSSNHVPDCEEMAKNEKYPKHHCQGSIHEITLKLPPIPSILNSNLETMKNNDKKEHTGCNYSYSTFGHQWAGGCILVSPPHQ